jgi:hypothetical protein
MANIVVVSTDELTVELSEKSYSIEIVYTNENGESIIL